ncbi:MAG: hypothetical protein ACFFAJ_09280 [Candidatus Hodarchaeota archaeon]
MKGKDQKNLDTKDQIKLKQEKDYEMLSFILDGNLRKKIYSLLIKRPSYAWEIAKKEKLNVSSVLRALRDLDKNKVILCLNPKSRRHKFYELTPEALNLKDEVLNSLKLNSE